MELVDHTVLEVGEYVAVPYAGKIFSDLGADVVKIEPPNGDVARRVGPFAGDPDPDASGFFGYLNTGKRSVVVPGDGDLARDVIRDLVGAEGVDVVLEEDLAAYGVDPRALAAEFPEVSVVSLSDFGATGPFQEHEAPDLVAWAESGHMNKMGYPEGPPVRPRIKITDYWAGQAVAIGALAALAFRDLGGGDGEHVDVSKREAALSTMDRFIAGYSWSGATTERTGTGYPRHDGQLPLQTIYEAADGYVSALPTTFGKWEIFCEEFLGRPDLAEDERFATRIARRRHQAETAEIIEEYTREHGKWDLFERFQEAGIASGLTSTPEDLLEFEHLHEREFWQDVELPNGEAVTMPGFPFRPGGPDHPVEMERAPRLGEHNAEAYAALPYDPTAVLGPSVEAPDRPAGRSRGPSAPSPSGKRPSREGGGSLPLDGIRVLDLSWVYAGPHTSKFLAALGADVVKVESAQKPDSSRSSAGYQFDLEPTSNKSASHNERNQGKRSLRLDLTNEAGRELALDLVREADVVMENFSPGFMDRVGLSYDRLREANPEIVYLSMPGIAKSGPAKNYRAYGLTLQSMIGLDYISGYPDDPPTTAGFSLPDPTAGYMGVVATLSGLSRRERTGEGTYIEIPQLELSASLLHKPLMEYTMDGRMPERTGDRDEDGLYVQGVYECAGEDRWAAVAVGDDGQWRRLCEVVGRPDLADDGRFSSQYRRFENHDAVDEVIEAWTRERSREEVRERLQDHDVPAGIVADERDLLDYDEQLRAREYFTTHDHPEVGERTYQGVPFEMAGCDVRFRSRAPLFGEHTGEVLADWLGYTDAEVERMDDAGALY